MNIISQYNCPDGKTVYQLTQAADIDKLQNHDGETFTLGAYVYHETVNEETGEIKKALGIKTTEGERFATNSPYFIDSFMAIVSCIESTGKLSDAPVSIQIVPRKGKSNRTFRVAVWVD